MKVTPTNLPEVKLVQPQVFEDDRGFFLETYQRDRYAAQGIDAEFVQDNLSYSRQGILRGMHLQCPHPQGKLVYVLQGEVFDVAVDVRVGSPTFAQWVGQTLSGQNNYQLWIPEGFAHGFCVTSETALLAYKCSDFYHREAEISLRWDDPQVRIHWPITHPELSEKDSQAPLLANFDYAKLPHY